MQLAAIVAVGLVVGVAYAVFGAGGSAFATPALALIGVPPIAAVASPLVATIPAALIGAARRLRDGSVDLHLVRRCLIVAVPAALAGAEGSALVPGRILLAMSAALLVPLGVRMLRRGDGRTVRPAAFLPIAGAVGLLSGLLANGGGFLLVPLFVLGLGMGMRRAAGTSLVTAAALAVPTLAAHWLGGHIDWTVATAFGAGLIPGSGVGSWLSSKLDVDRLRPAFGIALLVLATASLSKLR